MGSQICEQSATIHATEAGKVVAWPKVTLASGTRKGKHQCTEVEVLIQA